MCSLGIIVPLAHAGQVDKTDTPGPDELEPRWHGIDHMDVGNGEFVEMLRKQLFDASEHGVFREQAAPELFQLIEKEDNLDIFSSLVA